MSTDRIPTPAEVAAANRLKREQARLKEENIGGLLALCVTAMNDYTGDECVVVQVDEKYLPHRDDVEKQLPGWYLAIDTREPLVTDGKAKLYMGSKEQIVAFQATLIQPAAAVPAVEAAIEPSTAPPAVEATTEPAAPATAEAATEPSAAPPAVSIIVPAKPRLWVPGDPALVERRTYKLLDLEPQTRAVDTITAHKAFGKVLLTDVEACSTGGVLLGRAHGFHGLIETAHTAFAKHYGLELSPDDIWLTIVQGFARLVNQEPELFRNRFVTHSGQQLIEIRRDGFIVGSPDNDWASCFAEFSEKIGDRIGLEKHSLLVSDFSTTGAIERAASEVVLMDTVQSYFKYKVNTLCGIPFLTLRGSVADWENVARKVRGLAQFGDIGWWLEKVYPIIDQFVAAAKGTVDPDFWNRIYKKKEQSGGVCITGWLLHLLPCIDSRKEGTIRNPMLDSPYPTPHAPNKYTDSYGYSDDDVELDPWSGDPCINTSSLPSSLSTVPFEWNYFGKVMNYQFIAGIVGFVHNPTDRSVRPQMGWAVRPTPNAGTRRRSSDDD